MGRVLLVWECFRFGRRGVGCSNYGCACPAKRQRPTSCHRCPESCLVMMRAPRISELVEGQGERVLLAHSPNPIPWRLSSYLCLAALRSKLDDDSGSRRGSVHRTCSVTRQSLLTNTLVVKPSLQISRQAT